MNVLERKPTKGPVYSQIVQKGDVGAVYGGTIVEGNVSVQEALTELGLDFRVGLDKVRRASKTNGFVIPGVFAPYREDTGKPLGCTVLSRYRVVQNTDAFGPWAETLRQEGNATVSCGGVLHEGKRVWLCLDFGNFDVLPGDTVNKHLLIMNSHDGQSNLIVQLLAHRPVCQNVLNWSLGVRGGGTTFKVRHTESALVRLEEIQRILQVTQEGFQSIEDAFLTFREIKTTPEDDAKLIYLTLGVSDTELEEYLAGALDRQPAWVNQKTHIQGCIEQGPGTDISGVRGTLWGTFNGFTAWADHLRTVRGSQNGSTDSAVASRLLLYDAKFKARAFNNCVDFAKHRS